MNGTTGDEKTRRSTRQAAPWRAVAGAAVAAVAVVAAGATLGGCAADPVDAPRAEAGQLDAVAAVDTSVTPPVEVVVTEETVAPNGVVVEVQSLDNSFRVQDLTVEVGTEVVFENVGRNEHNIVPEPDSIQGWGVAEIDFGPGAVYSHVFSTPGVYAYVCTIHGVNGKGMVGTVTVEPIG